MELSVQELRLIAVVVEGVNNLHARVKEHISFENFDLYDSNGEVVGKVSFQAHNNQYEFVPAIDWLNPDPHTPEG